MKYIKNIISALLGLILGCAMTYTMYHNKPPNLRPYKRNKVHANHRVAKVRKNIITHVTVTCYQPLSSQCDNDPLTTSDGSKINLKHLKQNKIRWCAISKDLLYLFPKDKPKKIWIDGYGIYEVKDVMNKRHKHRVDLLIHPSNSKMIKLEDVKIKIYK